MIIPIGQTCNITFLMQNARLKKQTTLFEWFISKSLKNITNILCKIQNNEDVIIGSGTSIIGTNRFAFIETPDIRSAHYTVEQFPALFERRKHRLLDSIRNNNKITFARFDFDNIYTTEDIDDFVNAVKNINPNCNVNLLLISNKSQPTHPTLITIFYDKHSEDPYCKSKEINDLFCSVINRLGYQTPLKWLRRI